MDKTKIYKNNANNGCLADSFKDADKTVYYAIFSSKASMTRKIHQWTWMGVTILNME
jgi:hypothetical protein